LRWITVTTPAKPPLLAQARGYNACQAAHYYAGWRLQRLPKPCLLRRIVVTTPAATTWAAQDRRYNACWYNLGGAGSWLQRLLMQLLATQDRGYNGCGCIPGGAGSGLQRLRLHPWLRRIGVTTAAGDNRGREKHRYNS
jgi:hypothetical protein